MNYPLIIQLLEGARALINNTTFIQGAFTTNKTFETNNEGYDVDGAIQTFASKDGAPYTIDVWHAILVFKEANRIKGSIWEWNDEPHRDKTEVLAAFDKAIQHARTQTTT